MAIIQLQPPFEQITGELGKKGIVHRQKHYRDASGKILFVARQEAYAVTNPRNYKKMPPQGAELDNITVFKRANDLTTLILHSADYTTEELQAMSSEERARIMEFRSLLDDFKRRYAAQRSKPDPEAPMDKRTHRRKQYVTLNTFIRALLIHRINSSPSTPQ